MKEIHDFLVAVKADADLKAKYDGCAGDRTKIAALAASAGFTFTEEQLKEDLGDVLSLEELERVSGGAGDATLEPKSEHTAHPCLP